MMTDPIADMLTRIRNAHMRFFKNVNVPASHIKGGVLSVLEREGYINGFSEFVDDNGHKVFRVDLRYHDGRPVIKEICRVSKPGCRTYTKSKKISPVFNGFGVSILSTSIGILSDSEAKSKNVGGEVLCKVF